MSDQPQILDSRREHRYAIAYERARRTLALALQSAQCEISLSESPDLPGWKDEKPLRDRLTSLLDSADDRNAAIRALQLLDRVGKVRSLYLQAHQKVARVLVQKYRSHAADREDLLQEASLGLLRAMDRFDWHRGVRFSTYAHYWVKERILTYVYGQNKTIRLPAWVQKLWGKVHALTNERGHQPDVEELSRELGVSERRVRRVLESRKTVTSLSMNQEEGDLEIADERFRPESHIEEKGEIHSVLQEAMEALNEREREVVSRRFGLSGRGPEGLTEIASDLGLSSERIRQIQHAALARLKGHSRLGQFADCLA